MNTEWPVRTLGELCGKPQYGYTASASFAQVGPRFLRITDLQNGTLNWDRVPFCECSEGDRDKYRLNNGDIVVARIGATTGRTSLILDPPEAVFASYLIRLRPGSEVNPFYIFFFTQSQNYKSWIDGNKDNNLKGGVNASILTQIDVPFPTKGEQERIAAILWSIQRAIEIEETLTSTARELKQAVMRQLFTHGLRREPLKDTELGPLPCSWSTKLLDSCCEVVSSSISYTDFSRMSEDTTPDAVAAMGIKVSDMNLPGNELRMCSANLEKRISKAIATRKLLPPETIVFPKRGAAIATNKKRVTTAWTVLDPNLIGVRAGSGLDSEYLFHWFQNFDLRTITEPGPTPQLNKKNLTPLLLPIPEDEHEQQEIASHLTTIDRKISLHERKRAALQELFQTLLHELMTGEIGVADLDIDVSEVTA